MLGGRGRGPGYHPEGHGGAGVTPWVHRGWRYIRPFAAHFVGALFCVCLGKELRVRSHRWKRCVWMGRAEATAAGSGGPWAWAGPAGSHASPAGVGPACTALPASLSWPPPPTAPADTPLRFLPSLKSSPAPRCVWCVQRPLACPHPRLLLPSPHWGCGPGA